MESGTERSPAFLQVKVTSSAQFSFPLPAVFLWAIVSPSLLIPPLRKMPHNLMSVKNRWGCGVVGQLRGGTRGQLKAAQHRSQGPSLSGTPSFGLPLTCCMRKHFPWGSGLFKDISPFPASRKGLRKHLSIQRYLNNPKKFILAACCRLSDTVCIRRHLVCSSCYFYKLLYSSFFKKRITLSSNPNNKLDPTTSPLVFPSAPT